MIRVATALCAALLVAASPAGADAPAGPAPAAAPVLEHMFSIRVEVAPAVETGTVAGTRRRFIAITGGTVTGPALHGIVLPGGGDWQTIEGDGLTIVEARYFLRAGDGTVITAFNPGVRVADPAVIAALSRGEDVDPAAYYFRTTPRFDVADGAYGWMRRTVFVARGVRRPDHVLIDVYAVR